MQRAHLSARQCRRLPTSSLQRSLSTTPFLRKQQPSGPSTPPTKPPTPADQQDAEHLSSIKALAQKLTESVAIRTRKHADEFTANAKTTFSRLGFHLNKMTGYDEIDALKRQVVEQEEKIKATREAAREAKQTYEIAVQERSNSQREVNELLHRKSSWTDADVLRFTEIVRQDHSLEQALFRAKALVESSDAAVEAEFSHLMRLILGRYHEEQIWSDKIRSASTYGQMTALGLNLFVFVLAIVLVEPWKRKRLAATFEKKVDEMGVKGEKTVEDALKVVTLELEEKISALREELKVELLGVSSLKVQDVEDAVELLDEIEARDTQPLRSVPVVLHDLNQRTNGLLPDINAGTELGVVAASSATLALAIGWLVRSQWS